MFTQLSRIGAIPLSLLTLILLVPFITACQDKALPHITSNESIQVIVGQGKTAKVQVENWNTRAQLVLVPGGPYRKNFYPSTNAASHLTRINQYVFAIERNRHLSVIDFDQHPANLTAQHELQDQVTAIAAYKQYLIVGYKQQGTLIYDVKDVSMLDPIAHIRHDGHATKIKQSNGTIYILLNHHHVLMIQAASSNNSEETWRQVAKLPVPDTTTDFAINNNQAIVIGRDYGLSCLSIVEPTTTGCKRQLQGEPSVVTISKNFAYIASGSGGLSVLDVSTPGQATWLGSHNKFDSIDDVRVSDERAYVLDRGLRIASINIANKNLPITGSFYKPEGKIITWHTVADHAYLATAKGIEEVHLPEQVHTQISNEGINQGGTRRAYIDNNIAYVADWFSGLHLYDISDPGKPRHLSNYHTPGSSKGVVVDKGIAYVGDDDHGLQIIDVSNPSQPKKISAILTTGLAYTLKKQDHLVYLADHRGGFHIIDVSDSQQPFIVSSHDTAGKSWAIDVKGTIAFIADDTSGLLIFDVSDPKHPVQIGQFNPHGAAEDVVVKGHLAYVSFFDLGLYILDVSRASKPVVVSHLPVPGNARSIALQGDYAYIAGWESGLNIVDISNPQAPFIIGYYDTKGSAWGADISKQHAFVWDWWGGVKVINIENPSQPLLAGKYHTRGEILRLRQKTHYIYTANGSGGVQVFDVKNPLNPIWVTGIDIPGNTVEVWLSEHSPLAYAANSEHEIYILDISDPFYIRPAGQFKTEGPVVLLREYKQTVYAATEGTGLSVYRTHDNNHANMLQQLSIDINDMQVINNTLLVASNDQGLLTFPINDDGTLDKPNKIIDHAVKRITANPAHMVTATDNSITLWQQLADTYQVRSTLKLDETISDLLLIKENLLISTPGKGVLSYDISNSAKPVLQTRYPATDVYGRFIAKGDALFFGGGHTISSVQHLPAIRWQLTNEGEVELNIPATLPRGSYHLELYQAGNVIQRWPNAIAVDFPRSKKPKLSMDDFEKLLEKHRSQQAR